MATDTAQGSAAVTLNPDDKPSTQQTYKELTELMLLERQLATAPNEAVGYRLLVAIIDRELPIAMNIPDPGVRDATRYAQWKEDMADLKKIEIALQTSPIPAGAVPRYTPLSGQYPKVEYKMDVNAETPSSRMMREDVGVISGQVMAQISDQAKLEASQYLRKHRRKIRTILNRYGIWTHKSEMQTISPSFGDEAIDSALASAEAGQPEPGSSVGGADEKAEEDEGESSEETADADLSSESD